MERHNKDDQSVELCRKLSTQMLPTEQPAQYAKGHPFVPHFFNSYPVSLHLGGQAFNRGDFAPSGYTMPTWLTVTAKLL